MVGPLVVVALVSTAAAREPVHLVRIIYTATSPIRHLAPNLMSMLARSLIHLPLQTSSICFVVISIACRTDLLVTS